MTEVLVSVLLPSRCRAALLHKAITSLADTAEDPQQAEVLVGADPDDTGTQGFTMDTPLPVRVLTAPQRWGRGRLHEYYNWLARHAAGEWLLIFNDDARMLTQGWDQITGTGEPGIALVGSNHGDHMFMALPAAWAQAAGFVAAAPDIDNFLFGIGQRLGCVRSLPVHVFHDPFYVTGNNGDATYWEGRADCQRVADAGWDRLFPDREQAMEQMTGAIRELPGWDQRLPGSSAGI